MRFRYIGEYATDEKRCLAYDCVFTPGAEIEVPAQYQSKARGNRFFEPVIEDAVIVDADVNEATEDGPSVVAEVQVDEADNGDPGEDYNPYDGMSKADLVAMAKERGIDVDGRWSPGKIISMIEAAKEAE